MTRTSIERFEYSIAWSPHEFAQMISRRLPCDLDVEEILDPQKMRQSTAPFAYVVQRTFLRPREVIQFLTEAKERGDPESTFITKDNLKDAEPTYSRWKVDDLKQEFSKAIPNFPDCLESLRQGVHRYESLAELEELVAQKKPKLAEEQGARWIVDQLFDTSRSAFVQRRAARSSTRARTTTLSSPLRGPFMCIPGYALVSM